MQDIALETEFTERKFGWGKDRTYPCGCRAYLQKPFKDWVMTHYCDGHYAIRLKAVTGREPMPEHKEGG